MPVRRKTYRIPLVGGKLGPKYVDIGPGGFGDITPREYKSFGNFTGSFIRRMRASQFLKLAEPLTPGGARSRIVHVPRLLRYGEPSGDHPRTVTRKATEGKSTTPPGKMGELLLGVAPNTEHPDAWKVTGHEGRHRAVYLLKKGDPLIPVRVITTDPGVAGNVNRRSPMIPENHLGPPAMFSDWPRVRENLRRGTLTKQDKFLISLPRHPGVQTQPGLRGRIGDSNERR